MAINIVPTRMEATAKIHRILTYKTYEEVSKDIGITKPTLYARLSLNNWKKSELVLIKGL